MKMLRIKDVAGRLCVSTKTVYRLINQGAMVPVKIGRATRIDEAELDEYVNSNRRGLR
ncbi:MAG: helix-turn-helix domain-containing protein [Kiritimatiellales bacterium]